MNSAAPGNLSSDVAPNRIGRIVLVVAVLHVALVLLFRFGLPNLFKPPKSEISIELGGTILRGDGGAGQRQVSATSGSAAQKHLVNSEPGQRQALDRDKATKAPNAVASAGGDSAVAAGVNAAPTLDADYKAAYLNNPKPPYPPLAFQMRIEGTVRLKALVLPDGSCGDVLLAQSSGNELLDRSALNTVTQWKFTPAQSQGKDIAQWVSIPITFALKRR